MRSGFGYPYLYIQQTYVNEAVTIDPFFFLKLKEICRSKNCMFILRKKKSRQNLLHDTNFPPLKAKAKKKFTRNVIITNTFFTVFAILKYIFTKNNKNSVHLNVLRRIFFVYDVFKSLMFIFGLYQRQKKG